ncbi:MAG: transketolase C-terminal domain-containing protein, partial [Phycisphaerales bacterium JB039]
MSSFSARSVRWLARLLASRAPGAGDVAPGVEAALDGATAVALAESLWCDVACLGATFPASIAARAWTRRLDGANAFGARPSAIEAESGAGALAAAIGASSAGARATAFISGQDLASCAELLHLAAGRRIPLVLHVATRMPAGSGVAFGGGHATWHSAADAGWIQLFATNVQEAVDLSLAARLAAERALIPVMIGIDGPETALAAQDVLLPEPALAAELLGAAGRRIKPPTPAQRIIFGEYREAVPRWHDLDEPALHGSVEPPEMAQNAAAAGSMFFGAHAQQAIDDAFARVGRRTGRELSSLRASNARAAELVIIAVGAVIEAAEIAAEHLRRRDGISVAVVGVRQCRPWPAAALRQRLAKARVVLTLERAEAPLGGSLLLRDVRSAADPAAAVRYCAAIHGVGGVAATPAQIAAACRRALAETIETLRIGVAVAPDAPSPKRQAILDAVRRDYPDAERQSVVAGPDDATATGFTIAVHRPAGAADESFAGQAAALLHSLAGGRLRTCAALEPPAYGAPATDVLMFGDGVPPGAEHADVAVLVASESGFCERQLQTLPSESVLIVPVSEQDPGPIDGDLAARLQQRRVRLVGAPVPAPRAYEQPAPAWRRHEALLGALAALVAGTLAGREITAAKAVAARRLLLDDLAPPDVQTRLEVFQAGFERHAPYAPDASAPAASPVPPPAPPPAPKFAGRPVKNPAEHWARTAAPAMQRRAVAPADPFAACGVTPAGTSARRSIAGPELLEFDPETCDGSAAPWVGCPDGAIAAVALGARELLECGIRMATRAGASADALTPVVGKLAQFAHKQALAAVRPPSTARELLEAPYHELVEKMAPEEARKAALDDAFRAVLDAIGMLPIVRTGALFDALEQAKAASGAFLIIGIDPDASRDPRSAAQDALGHGLRLVNRTPARLERARALWRIFEALPDTPGAIIAHAADQPSIGPMGAILLSRSCAMALATGDDAEPGSGDRLAVRLVLAACEAEIQPRTQRFLEQIRTLRDRLGARIHETLAGSLPDADLDALAEGLRTLGRDDVDLAELGRRVAGASESRRLDGVALSRLVDAARSLADLEWRRARWRRRCGPPRRRKARRSGATPRRPGSVRRRRG